MGCCDNLQKRTGVVTMKGGEVTLLGPALTVGDKAPEFNLLKTDMSEAKLSDYSGKTVILSTTPSLDTPVCDLQAKRFNQVAQELGDAVVLNISMDLPFAQKRWCGAAGVDKVITLSDHKEAALGLAFGVLIKELRLLARAVFVLDHEGIIRYIQIVKEVGDEPDYDAVLNAVRALIQGNKR